MTHVTDDVLAAIVLGDPDVTAADREHVEGCPVCAEELIELSEVDELLRAETRETEPHRVDAGPAVWSRIAAATVLPTKPEAVEAPTAATAETPVEPVPLPTGPGRHAEHRTRRSWWLGAAAAACLVVGVLVGRAVFAPSEPAPPVLASVPLTTLDAAKQREGTAELVQGQSATQLRVDTQPMSPGSGYIEVWLINTDGKRMVSLGVLSGTQSTFTVPDNALQQGYTIVDLSHEQYDDKPQHSGDSIMRGTLPV